MHAYYVHHGLLPPLPRWADHPCEATAGVSTGEEALNVSIRNIKKEIRKAKRGIFTPMSLEYMEEQLWLSKQERRRFKAEAKEKRKKFLHAQSEFCAELVASGFHAEWVPNDNTPNEQNPVLDMMQEQVHDLHL